MATGEPRSSSPHGASPGESSPGGSSTTSPTGSANLPRVVRPGEEERELSWWTPAFKVHPEHYVRFGRALTVRQPAEVAPAELVPEGCYPVTLDAAEIGESLKVLLVEMATPRRLVLSRSERIAIRPPDRSLSGAVRQSLRFRLTLTQNAYIRTHHA